MKKLTFVDCLENVFRFFINQEDIECPLNISKFRHISANPHIDDCDMAHVCLTSFLFIFVLWDSYVYDFVQFNLFRKRFQHYFNYL